jgi:hypothetical protein
MLPLLIALGAGLLIGFVMAIPVGPVGLIVFRRSMFKEHVSRHHDGNRCSFDGWVSGGCRRLWN